MWKKLEFTLLIFVLSTVQQTVVNLHVEYSILSSESKVEEIEWMWNRSLINHGGIHQVTDQQKGGKENGTEEEYEKCQP